MELSERLKALAKDFGGVRHWSRPTFAAQNLAGEVADNLPAILAALDAAQHKAKCVQFAEDVETLTSRAEAAEKEVAAISEAWNTYKVIRDPAEESFETFGNGFRAGAEWGRREALKEMCHDSDFDECQDGDWFWVLTDRGWNEAMKIGDGFEVITASGDCQFTCCREDVKRIVYVTLPSPAEAFGEGG